MPPAFALQGVYKSYLSRGGAEINALHNATFEAQDGHITCLLGPTAAGKSTILRLLAGLEIPDGGSVSVDGQNPDADKTAIGYLTQRHTLFPWLTVEQNIALPLELKGIDRNERIEQARSVMGSLGLKDASGLYPYELSGGMQQRAALGRLLCLGAKYWLMDEPFSNLDERTQHNLERLLLSLRAEHGLSVMVVTHSIDEAVFLADRVVMLSASPGSVVDAFDIEIPHPRNRMSSEYGQLTERIRRGIESVIKE